MTGPQLRIAILGAGNIGCYVGGLLAAQGHRVILLGRSRIINVLTRQGLRITAEDQPECRVPAANIEASVDPACLGDAQIILVTVKSADTPDAAEMIRAHARQDALVISLQNGVRNVGLLRQAAGRRVLGGMVPFNVMKLGDGWYHRATSGEIVVERDADGAGLVLACANLPVSEHADIAGIQYGKLLLNLNNALNALSGLTLREQLQDRRWRKLFADCITEALGIYRRCNIKPVSPTLPVSLLPLLLRSPDFIFHRVLNRVMKVDPLARSSMWGDLERHQGTEIDYLQGEIVELAKQAGLTAPLAARIQSLVEAASTAGRGSPRLAREQIVSS